MNFPLHLSKAVIEITEIQPKHRKASVKQMIFYNNNLNMAKLRDYKCAIVRKCFLHINDLVRTPTQIVSKSKSRFCCLWLKA